MGLDEVGTLRILTAYRVVVDRLIASHRGRIFNTAGDSLVADFASAVDAVQCAVDVQDAMTQENADRPAGEQQVKNITQPIRAYRVRGDTSPTATPVVGSSLPLPDKPSIAVLPFANMS